MQNLLDFIARYYHWLLFIVLEAVSGVLLFHANNYQGSVWVSTANAVAGGIMQWEANVEQYFNLTANNEALTQRNTLLEHRIARLRQQIDSPADSLDAALDGLHMVSAKVVGSTLHRSDNLITIDKGAADGLKVNQAVVSGTGIVGVVYMVGRSYSVVLPVLNSRSRISCSIRGRGYFGYLTWNGGDPSVAYVDDVPRHAKFRKGDFIETSGYSAIFPQGVTVGKIVQVYNSRDGLSYRLKVGLTTDFGRLRDVCVIDDPAVAERQQLLEAARDSLKN